MQPVSQDTLPSGYHVGDAIPCSGIYRAFHGDHRVAHDVTLLSGDTFPHCKQCGNTVTFMLIEAAPAAIHDRDFRIHIYEIPHPEPTRDTEQVA